MIIDYKHKITATVFIFSGAKIPAPDIFSQPYVKLMRI